jgi:membrane protein
MHWRHYAALVKQAAGAWVDDRASSMGAALSYYTVFSIAPLLLIVISVAGLVFGREAAQGAIVAQLSSLIGTSGAHTVQELLRSVSKPHEGVIATIAGVVLLLVGATTVFAELEDDLNRVWKVPPKAQPSGLWGWLRSRLLSIGLILAIGFLLLVSLAAGAFLSSVGEWSSRLLGGWAEIAALLNTVFSFAVVTALFAIIYRFMPQTRVEWRDVAVGSVVTALLFTVGKYLIGLYIGKSAVTSGFGAAGSLAVLLVWVYYSAQIFLLGAEFTAAFAHTYGSRQGRAQAPAGVPLAAGPGGVPLAAGQRGVRRPAPAGAASSPPSRPVPAAARALAASTLNQQPRHDAPMQRPPSPPGQRHRWRALVHALRSSPVGQFAGSAVAGAAVVLAFEWVRERPHGPRHAGWLGRASWGSR